MLYKYKVYLYTKRIEFMNSVVCFKSIYVNLLIDTETVINRKSQTDRAASESVNGNGYFFSFFVMTATPNKQIFLTIFIHIYIFYVRIIVSVFITTNDSQWKMKQFIDFTHKKTCQ